MSLTLQPGDKIVMFGDSITAGIGFGPWYAPWVTSVNATYTAAGTTLVSKPAAGPFVSPHRAGAVTTSPNLAPRNYSPTIINKGVGGNKIVDLIARVNADVIAQSPTVVIIEEGINDVIGGTDVTTFGNNAVSLLNTITSGLPGVRLAWVSCLCYGEVYPDPTWGPPINAINAKIQTAIAGAGGTYIDVRTPQQAYEAANNTPPPGVNMGILTNDSTHPNATGIPLMSTAALAVTTITGAPT